MMGGEAPYGFRIKLKVNHHFDTLFMKFDLGIITVAEELQRYLDFLCAKAQTYQIVKNASGECT